MADSTINYGFPYPEGDDKVATHTDIRALANALDVRGRQVDTAIADAVENSESYTDEALGDIPERVAPIQQGDDDEMKVTDRDGRIAFSVTSKGAVRVAGAEHRAEGSGLRITDIDGRVAFEVDANGRTRIYDGDSSGPTRVNSDAKFTPDAPVLPTYYPTYMDPRDRTTMINYNSSTLRYSRDEGATWAVSHVFEHPVTSGIIMANGEALIAIKPIGGGLTETWLSKGWQDDPATAAWTKVHTNPIPNAYPSGAFSWSEHKNIIVVADYGPKLGQAGVTDAARYVRLSRDYGKTWTTIFDLLTDHPSLSTMEGMHLHGVCYDPYWDRIWITHGDDNQGILFSDDFGETWHLFAFSIESNGPYQSVGIVALPKCVLFATDGHPNGVLRIDRKHGKSHPAPPIDIGYLHDEVAALTILCQSVWRAERPGDDAPVVFEFCSAPGDGRRFILTTVDGYAFNKVWEGDVTRGNSAGRAYGPTASGRLLHYAVDETFNKSGRTLRRGPMPNAY